MQSGMLQGFTKGALCQAERISFFTKMNEFLDRGGVADIICLYWISGN